MNINTEFNEDLFLTSEGRNLISYVKEKYKEAYEFLSLNEYLKPLLADSLNKYNSKLQDLILDKVSDIKAKEIAYQELISLTDSTIEEIQKMLVNSKEDFNPNTYFDTTLLN